eukprot:gene28183-34999_t
MKPVKVTNLDEKLQKKSKNNAATVSDLNTIDEGVENDTIPSSAEVQDAVFVTNETVSTSTEDHHQVDQTQDIPLSETHEGNESLQAIEFESRERRASVAYPPLPPRKRRQSSDLPQSQLPLFSRLLKNQKVVVSMTLFTSLSTDTSSSASPQSDHMGIGTFAAIVKAKNVEEGYCILTVEVLTCRLKITREQCEKYVTSMTQHKEESQSEKSVATAAVHMTGDSWRALQKSSPDVFQQLKHMFESSTISETKPSSASQHAVYIASCMSPVRSSTPPPSTEMVVTAAAESPPHPDHWASPYVRQYNAATVAVRSCLPSPAPDDLVSQHVDEASPFPPRPHFPSKVSEQDAEKNETFLDDLMVGSNKRRKGLAPLFSHKEALFQSAGGGTLSPSLSSRFGNDPAGGDSTAGRGLNLNLFGTSPSLVEKTRQSSVSFAEVNETSAAASSSSFTASGHINILPSLLPTSSGLKQSDEQRLLALAKMDYYALKQRNTTHRKTTTTLSVSEGVQYMAHFPYTILTEKRQEQQQQEEEMMEGNLENSTDCVLDLLENCTRLETFVALDRSGLTNDIVISLANNCHFIKELDLSGGSCYQFALSDVALIYLSSKCADLSVLRLSLFTAISDEGVELVLQNCSDLTELSLKHMFSITDVTLVHIGHHCKQLTVLTILNDKASRQLPVNSVQLPLLTRCSKLQSLTLGGYVLFTDTEHDGFRWVQNGYGSVFLNEGEHYTGNWKHGKLFDAQGTFTAPNGDVYVGGYKNDMKQGQGELTCASGAHFIGEWHEAQRVNGRNKYSSGEIYQGQFKNDLRHGHGILYRSHGKTPQYIGEWENDLKSGMGEFTYSNGDTHIGVWRNGRENGQGSRAYKSGDIYIGCMTYRNGHIYDGSWVDDHPHGRGTMYYPGGDFYDGMWVKGTMKYATGFTYSGDWEDNVRHGVGQHVTPKGYLLYDGRWKRDV